MPNPDTVEKFKTAAKNVPWLAWLLMIVVSVLVVSGAVKLLPWYVMVSALKNPDSLANAVWVWLTGSLLLFLLVNAFFFLATSLLPQKDINLGMVFTTFWALSVAILILLLIFSLPGTVIPAFGVFSAIAGGVLGWLLGIGLTPENVTQRQTFAGIQTKIVAGVAGVAGISLKSAWDWFAKPAHNNYRIYLAFTFLSALVSLAAVYINRQAGSKTLVISFPEGTGLDRKDKHRPRIKVSDQLELAAAVTGFSDTSVLWELVPRADGAAQSATLKNGCFQASVAGNYRVSARSNCDPSLVDTVTVCVVG